MGIARLFRWLLLLVLAVAAAGGAYGYWYLRQPLPLPASPYEFKVPAGASLSSVAREFKTEGIIVHPLALVGLARWRGVDRNIKAGNYEVREGITLPGLLSKLIDGDVTQSSLTIVEGTTFAQLKAALGAHAQVKQELAALPDADLLSALRIDAAHPEGQFFPDTYFFAAGSTDAAVLDRAHRMLQQRLDAAWEKRAPDLPLATPYQALILASIVEKETGRAADRGLVASVFINRLRIGMRLQTDPAVIYGMGERFDGNLTRRDLETDTPYNTYTRAGLPPTPIALPSQASIEAVLNPPVTKFLYFVSRGDGTSEFTGSLVDHNRAVTRYQLKRSAR